jgi:hypothetical protein
MAGAGAALPFVAAGHPFLAHLTDVRLDEAEVSLGAADWAPQFLSPGQNDLLISLSEAIVPGSRNAEVNRFIDLLLSVDTVKNQKEFAQALSATDAAATKQFGKSFPDLSATEQASLLTAASTEKSARSQDEPDSTAERKELTLRDHFENLKGWISGAYYSSEVGMKELGWTPNRVFAHFPQCEHPDDHV